MILNHPSYRLLFALFATVVVASTSGCRPRTPQTVQPRVEFTLQKVAFQIGDSTVYAHVTVVGTSPLTMIHLHEDEVTSAQAGQAVVEKHGGRLIELVHSGQRRVSFSLDGAKYSFDPNRIFTEEGVRKTVRGEITVSENAYAAVREFATQFVQYFALERQPFLIAIHNNGEGLLSIASYAPGADNGVDTDKFSINPEADPDNFNYVTDERFFSLLKEQKFNVVLQNNQSVRDDGSLSVFAGHHRIPYINVEAQDGQLAENVRMLEAAVKISTSGL